MGLENLTLNDLRKLTDALSGGFDGDELPATGLAGRYAGQYVIVRSRNEGLNAGTVVAADETGIILKGARRLYYHGPKDKSLSWYEGVAISGLADDSRVSPVCPGDKAIVEDYSVTVCSDGARKSIQGFPAHVQG